MQTDRQRVNNLFKLLRAEGYSADVDPRRAIGVLLDAPRVYVRGGIDGVFDNAGALRGPLVVQYTAGPRTDIHDVGQCICDIADNCGLVAAWNGNTWHPIYLYPNPF